MRFLARSLIGLVLFALGLGAAGYGAWRVAETMAARSGDGAPKRPAEEREYAVEVGVVSLGEIAPEITAYGEIRGWRTLELRAASGGYLVELSDRFRDGAAVAAGDFLFRIDPDDPASRVADAEAAVAEAEADLAEAEQAVEVALQEARAAETQRDLRETALNRREGLRDRGVSTAAEVEEAEMAFASAEQTVASRAQMTLAARIKIDRTRLRLDRARLTLEEARRDLAETEHTAPFTGVLSDVNATLGALATPNERLGLLVDPTALEAAFRVSNRQFARLLDANGALKPTPVEVTLDLDEAPLVVTGVVDRAGAVVEAGETGRRVFARLDLTAESPLRPGDFVTVSITEPPLRDVARLPAAAVTEAGALLLLGDDDRLREIRVDILRRTGDDVIVSGVPDGVRFVAKRAPQLGAGVKARPLAAPSAPKDDLVRLDVERQERLIEAVELAEGLPDDRKARILERLRSGAAPRAMIERIEARLGDVALVDIDPERQARLIGAVEDDAQMSAEMKVRILSRLRSGRAPKALVDRIEARLGDAG